jgi:hypothetical protein
MVKGTHDLLHVELEPAHQQRATLNRRTPHAAYGMSTCPQWTRPMPVEHTGLIIASGRSTR